MSPVFVVATCLGAFLLFLVQPLIARCLLPWFGGAPSVWTVSMLCFQSLLLAGYAFSHLLASRVSARAQSWIYPALLVASLALLPIVPSPGWRPVGDEVPELRLLLTLLATVGGPFLLLSTASPLLQSWLARAAGRSPYHLYALSNGSSLLALLSYPLLFEPLLGLRSQAWVWTGGYAAFTGLGVLCARRIRRTGSREPGPEASGPQEGARASLSTVALWILLPACGSVVLLSVTNELTRDVAAAPFLWVLPLSLYLLSFVVPFGRPRWYRRRLFLPLSLLSVLLLRESSWVRGEAPFLLDLSLWSLVLFALCTSLHGELHRTRPAPRRLTAFYLCIAAGGACGGVFVGLVAPLVFDGYTEVWVGLVGALGLTGVGLIRSGPATWRRRLVPLAFAGTAAIAVAVLAGRVAPRRGIVERTRGFYGVLEVFDDATGVPWPRMRYLVHGRIVHGAQVLDPALRGRPTTYYGRSSGLGLALDHRRPDGGRRIGAVGLGPGTIAAYGRPGDRIRFYEINPEVCDLARRHFSFLEDSPAELTIVPGDARISLEREAPQRFDILVLDAFSGDAPPAHLLTREAFEVYLRHVAPSGAVLVNISNRHLDLAPVVRGAARALRLSIAIVSSADSEEQGGYASDWVILTRDAEGGGDLREFLESHPDPAAAEAVLWTDDRSSLLPLLF